MTLLIGWIGIDQRGPASLYLASDSRISWGKGPTWDRGKKLFTSKKPHILGFYGDVLFPSSLLSQVIEQIDNDLLFAPDAPPTECFQQIVEFITLSLEHYPESISCDFGILHGMRQGELMDCKFHLSAANFTNRVPTIEPTKVIGPASDLLAAKGSGAVYMRGSFERWTSTRADGGGLVGTSRAVFSAMADAIRSGQDPHTGGPPQLVGMYRKGPARAFGVVWEQKRWVLGAEVMDDHGYLRGTKWHNDLFEVVDPVALSRDKLAHPQPRPRNLKNKR